MNDDQTVLDAEAPSVPDGFMERLQAIRSTFHLKWNRRAVMVKKGHYDAEGRAYPPVYEGRWEVWDTPETSPAYKILVVRNVDNSFQPLSDRLLQRLQKINPENHGGDLNKLFEALTEDPETRHLVHEREGDDFLEAVAEWAYWVQLPKQRVLADIN